VRFIAIIIFSIMWKYSFPQTEKYAAERNEMMRSQIAGRGITDRETLRVTVAANEIPRPLIDQLAENGRLVIPVGGPGMIQELMLLVKKNGRIEKKRLSFVRFVPFKRL
jgi:hypothetical protein